MDFLLNEDQIAFADSAKAVFADYCAPEQHAAYEAGSAGYMQSLWQQCVANGLHTMVVPESAGGLGLGMTELMAVLVEQGKAMAHVPLYEHQLAAAAIAQFGSQAAQGQALAAAMEGEGLLCLATQGLLAGTAGQVGAVKAVQDGAVLKLTGYVPAVPYADSARYVLLVCTLEGKQRLALVNLQRPDVKRVAGRNQAQQGVASMTLNAVEIPADMVLAEAAAGWLEPRAVAFLSALQLGVSVEQLTQTVQYVSERKQFERPIGTFQLVQGKMADCQMAVEALRTALYQLVYRLDAGLGTSGATYATRVLACECGHLVGTAAQHVHGGIGVDITYPVHRFGCWSRTLNIAHGGMEQNLAALGAWLAQSDKLGWKYDSAEEAQGVAA